MKLYKNIAMLAKNMPPVSKLPYRLPFPRKNVLASPQRPESYTEYAIYQTALVTKDIISSALGDKYKPYYSNYKMDNGSNVKKSKFSHTNSPANYTFLLKSDYIMTHLYKVRKEFLDSRRRNYSYYVDKFNKNEQIDGAVMVEINSKDWIVYEGNHRAIAQYDLGYEQMVCEVRYNYHDIFSINYPFVKVW
jgi:hypothetical protein